MEVKKNPKSNLENFSKIFMQLGLVLALVVVYIAIEHKTYERTIDELGASTLTLEEEDEEIITQRIEVVPPPPPPPPPATPEVIQVVEDDSEVEETIIESTETDEEEVVELSEIVEIAEEEDVVEDVPFAIIEDVPVYPGCEKKKTNEKKKACLSENITKHVSRKFNADLAADLGLAPGKKRIIVMFTINEKGDITGIRARAPHKRLEKEAVRVVSILPKMKPGKQRGKAVRVKYSLPIVFNVE